MTQDQIASLSTAFERALEAHTDACVELGHATAMHNGPRKRRNAAHRDPLERAHSMYMETARDLRAAHRAILAALESA